MEKKEIVGELDEKVLRERAARAERARRRRAEHKAAGLCKTCTKPAVEGKGQCVDCAARAVVWQKSWRKDRGARWDALREEALRSPITVPCPFCGKKALDVYDMRFGEPRVVCDDCKREFGSWSPPPAFPCPYCGGRCLHQGREPDGKRTYKCAGCGKWNTGGWPADRPSPGGPFRHMIGICLGPYSHTNLMRYCQEHKMSQAQAVRQIFRAVLDEPLHKMSSSRRSYNTDGSYYMSVRSATAANDPRYDPNQRFPNITSETTKRRMAQGGKRHRTAGVSSHVTVMLDDLAKEGLMKATVMFQMDHQRAARFLIERAA